MSTLSRGFDCGEKQANGTVAGVGKVALGWLLGRWRAWGILQANENDPEESKRLVMQGQEVMPLAGQDGRRWVIRKIDGFDGAQKRHHFQGFRFLSEWDMRFLAQSQGEECGQLRKDK